MNSNDYTYGSAAEVADRLMYEQVEFTDTVGALANAMRRIAALETQLAELRRGGAVAANTASCLANGRKPD